MEEYIQDRMYNGDEVIDAMAETNVNGLLQSPIMDNIVSRYWESPYDKAYFFSTSNPYRVIKSVSQ